ncbi:MAG: sulfurtransferase TusA family protein [Pseudomonadota bacterium]
MDVKHTIDARGLLCPLPVLKLRKRMKSVSDGEVVALWADDPAAAIDVPHYCTESGHELVGQDEATDHVIYRVRKRM